MSSSAKLYKFFVASLMIIFYYCFIELEFFVTPDYKYQVVFYSHKASVFLIT